MRHSLLALSLMGLSVGLLSGCSDTPEEAPARPVRLITVAEEALVPAMELSGEVRARVESRLAFRVPGKIIQRSVETGQRVRRGQELARLDPTNESLQSEAAQARLNSAQAERDLAASEYERFTDLHSRGHISTNELERRRITLDNAEAQLALAKSDASRAANQLAYTILRADADGVIVSVMGDVGEVVGVGQPVMQLAHEGARDAVVEIPEDRLDLVRAASAEVSLWSAPQQRYPATLRELSASANPTTRTFTARYAFEISPEQAVLGKTATLHLAIETGLSGIPIPSAAMIKLGDQSGVWLYDEESSTINKHPVQVIGYQGSDILVAGLQAGVRIASAGVHTLVEGQAVRPLNTP